MATIRIRDWTKERIEEIREAESHSSHDSVIKSLLKDRELARFAGEAPAAPKEESADPVAEEPEDKAFDDLTVLAELRTAENGLLFLWCPSCGNEIAHIGLENPIQMSVFEVECQRCLTRLDQHAIVGIEIGYPIEERVVEDRLQDDLKACVVDYWDRTLELRSVGPAVDPSEDVDDEYLVWQFDQYRREFDWEWPADVPVVGVEPGGTYRDESTGTVFEVLEPVSENRNAVDDYRVRKYPDGDPESGEGHEDVVDAATIVDAVVDRSLSLVESPHEGSDAR